MTPCAGPLAAGHQTSQHMAYLGGRRTGRGRPRAQLIGWRFAAGALPASERDVEIAKRMFGGEGDITEYIVRLGISVENTTRAQADAIHRGDLDSKAVPEADAAGGGLQAKGEER